MPDLLCRVGWQGRGGDATTRENTSRVPRMHMPQDFHRACLERWLRTKNTCPTCRYELPYEEEPELRIEVEDEENEAQRLADGEVGPQPPQGRPPRR